MSPTLLAHLARSIQTAMLHQPQRQGGQGQSYGASTPPAKQS